MDLRDLWRPDTTVTPRFVLWIAGQLPADSALAASRQGGAEFRPWTPTVYLLAAITNLTNAANRQRAGKRTRDQLVKPPTKRTVRRVSVAGIAARQRALEAKN